MRLTVFTPTYNRRELLARAYASLKVQTSKDFEWLIVDDGSTDGTDDEVKKCGERSPLLPSRRGPTPRVSLECNPEIPVAPGVEHYVLDTSLDKVYFALQ